MIYKQCSISLYDNLQVDKQGVSVCSRFTTLLDKNDDNNKTLSCLILYERHTKVVVFWIMEKTRRGGGGGVLINKNVLAYDRDTRKSKLP